MRKKSWGLALLILVLAAGFFFSKAPPAEAYFVCEYYSNSTRINYAGGDFCGFTGEGCNDCWCVVNGRTFQCDY